jgi:hypothetical protein
MNTSVVLPALHGVIHYPQFGLGIASDETIGATFLHLDQQCDLKAPMTVHKVMDLSLSSTA